MTDRAFRSMLTVSFTVLVFTILLILTLLYNYFTEVQQTQLRYETSITVQVVEKEGTAWLEQMDTGENRITWIAPDGTVLYDNRKDQSVMENHLEREEIRQAMSEGMSESIRYSSTMSERLLYCAQKLSDGSVLRLSIAQYTVWALFVGMLQPVAIVVLFAMIISFLLADRLAKGIMKPLNRLDLDHPLDNDCYDELAPLLRRISVQQDELRQQSSMLTRQKNELDTIIGAMQEGMLLTDAHGDIVSINPRAKEILHAEGDCIGEDVLLISRDPSLQKVLQNACSGQSDTRQSVLAGRTWQIMGSPVKSSAGVVAGAALLMIDVTEKQQAEQLRREFTANVSHELKSPVHVISGYAEMMESGMAKPEDVHAFAGRILSESRRLTRLIEDIISLSHLDEGAEEMPRLTVDLYAEAQSTIRSLTPAAQEAGVTLSLSGESVTLYTVPRLLQSVLVNLCDNAVKYNRKGGSVEVNISGKPDGAVLTVKDTGIGIPAEDLSRIFERFYRVDKSHSRAVGGTGLGLSIVKHSAEILKADVKVQSRVVEGTVFTVTFPKGETK